MSGPIVRSGPSKKFSTNWDQAFGASTGKGTSKGGAKASAKKTAAKKPAKGAGVKKAKKK